MRPAFQHCGLQPTLIVLIAAAITVLMAVRFVGLSEAPPGFYVDEAAIAAQVICLRTTGADADGNSQPLFADVLGGGQASPPTLYLGAPWTTLWGDDVASFRSLAAAAGVVILVSVALVTWRLGAQPLAVPAVLLIAASSPWLFHLSRVFWAPIIAAAAWAAALAAYVYASRSATPLGRSLGWLAFAMLSVAAVYGYPPLRIQVAASWVILLLFDQGVRHWRHWLLAGLTAAALSVPLLSEYLDEGFRARGSMLAIWNEGWLAAQGKTLADLPLLLLQQIGAHLDPGYLFFHGDQNLRHGSGFGGLIGATELVMLAAGLLMAGRLPRMFYLMLGLTLAGILPAALTWESTPHALRSIGAIGPWLMSVGILTAALFAARPAPPSRLLAGITLVALVSALIYGLDYQTRYREASRHWFDTDARPFEDRRYPELARRYFEMRDGASCRP